jgi:hypothetical protein
MQSQLILTNTKKSKTKFYIESIKTKALNKEALFYTNVLFLPSRFVP